LLAPGEIAAPGTANGKTGTPATQNAGTAFNATVNAVDASWNLVNTVTDSIKIAPSDPAAVAVTNSLVAGTKLFSMTLKTAPSQTLTASDLTQPAKTPNTSPSITVNPGASTRLTILTQPSTNATAGVVFAQQPVIRIEDAFGNLQTTDSTTVVTAAIATGSGTLQGTTNITAVGGLASFTNLFHNVATTLTISFSVSGLTSTNSSNVVVSAGAFVRLQMLAPGETNAPGTTTGKTGSPNLQTAGTALNMTVNAVDANWNTVTSGTDTVSIASSDTNATLAVNAPLVSGTRSLSVTFKPRERRR